MSLRDWENSGYIKRHKTSAEEVRNLFEIVKRDLKDARNDGLSTDWRFGIAYNAALKLCTIALFASGYRADRNQAHFRTVQSLALTLGSAFKDDSLYLDVCRAKRNETEYDFAGGIADDESDELITFTEHLQSDVKKWLREKRPDLLNG